MPAFAMAGPDKSRIGASQTFELVFNPAGYHNNVVSRVTFDVG